jgi:hypothetical protein
MRPTEAQIRRTVRGILREGLYPDLPEPDRRISGAIDAIGEKIRREVENNPGFDILRHRQILDLFVREHMREIKIIARLMTRQAQLLAPILLRDKERLKAGLTSNIVLQNIENFAGEIDDELEKDPTYVDDEIFGSLDRLETGIVKCIDTLMFQSPSYPPRRRANHLSELTDEIVYSTLLGIHSYLRPSLRS